MSQQLNLLSGGHIANLDHFSLPAGVVLKAVPHGSARFTERHDSGRVRAGFAAANGEREMLLPEARSWWLDVPLLVLQLDQGPTCCGGAALLCCSLQFSIVTVTVTF